MEKYYGRDGYNVWGIMRTFYKGYYGKMNTGDDAFCSIVTWGGSKYWGVDKAYILSSSVAVTRVSVDTALVHVGIPGIEKIQAAFLPLFHSPSRVIFGGGSIFHSMNGFKDPNVYYRYFSQMGITSISAVGVSIGPFKSISQEDKIRKFLDCFEYIALRDSSSMDWAKNNDLSGKVVLTSDLAGLLPLVYPQQGMHHVQKAKKIIGISLCRYESYKKNGDLNLEREREEKLVGAIKLLLRNNDIELHFFIFNGHDILGDSKVTNNFHQMLDINPQRYKQYSYSPDAGAIYKKVSECDAFIAVRLHAAIFAHMAGVPFTLLEYHKKCSDYLDDVGQPHRLRMSDDMSLSDIKNILEILLCDKPIPLKTPMEMSILAEQSFLQAPWASIKHE